MTKKQLNRFSEIYLKNRNVISLSIGTLIISISQVVVIAFLSRILSREDFGILAIIQILLGFSLIFTQFGASQVLIQRNSINKKFVDNAQWFSLITGLITSIIVAILASFIAHFFSTPKLVELIYIISPFFFIKSFSICSEALLIRHHKFIKYSKYQILSYVFGYAIVSIIFAFLGFGYYSVVYGMYAQLIVQSILVLNYYPFYLTKKRNFKEIKLIAKDGGGFVSISILNYLIEEIDGLLIGRYMGVITLGMYERAFRIYSLSTRFFTLIYDKISFPYLSKRQDNKTSLEIQFEKSNSLSFLLLIPFSAFLIILSPLIVKILLGDSWNDVVIPLKILLMGIPFRFGFKISKNILNATNNTYKTLPLYCFYVGLVFVLIFYANKYGIIIITLIVLSCTIINYFNFMLFSIKVLNFRYTVLMRVLKICAYLLLPSIIINILIYKTQSSPLLITFYGIIYIFLVFIIYRMEGLTLRKLTK